MQIQKVTFVPMFLKRACFRKIICTVITFSPRNNHSNNNNNNIIIIIIIVIIIIIIIIIKTI